MLDLNKFLAGKIVLQPRRCSLLADVLKPAVAMLPGRSGSGPMVELVTDDCLWVKCDSLRLKQASVRKKSV